MMPATRTDVLTVERARTFVLCACSPPGGLGAGLLSRWDSMRIAQGAIDAAEWRALAFMIAAQIRRDWPEMFEVRHASR